VLLLQLFEDQYLAGPILCLGYAAALAIDILKHPNRRIYRYFSTVGRMALTNYLSQSVVLTFISYGWGLGYALKLNGFQVMGIVCILYFLQIAVSNIWLRNFIYGPLEWIWRCITYWKALPIRITVKGSK
jgi:uncharacterized protein